MTADGERFGLHTYEDWSREAHRVLKHDLASFAMSTGGGAKIRIEPGIVEQRGVTVVGHDWIPILPDGRATLDRMVHTPELYVEKMRNILPDGDGFRMSVRRTVVCGRDAVLVGGSRNYYHWLINHVPRLLWARQLGLLGSRVILVNDRLTSFQQQTLEILNISRTQIMEISDDEAVVCANLLVPTFLARTTIIHPVVPELLKRALRPSQRASGRRVYISRRDAGSRRLVNEAQIERMLATHGFEAAHLTSMSLQAQIDLFSSAEIVVGAHGAGLTNILFCSPGTRVIEIYTPLHKVTSMRVLSAVRTHRHVMVPAENISVGDDGNPLLGDWSVDVALLERALVEG